MKKLSIFIIFASILCFAFQNESKVSKNITIQINPNLDLDTLGFVLTGEIKDTAIATKYVKLAKKAKEEEKFEDELRYRKKVLEIYKEVFPNGDSLNADAYLQLGVIYTRQKNRDSVNFCLNNAIQISETQLGENNTIVASCFHIFGLDAQNRGDYGEAIVHYKKALGIRINILGENNLKTAQTLNNLGNATGSLGEYKEGLNYLERVLKIRKQILGEDDLSVADVYLNLGISNRRLGNYSKAIKYYDKSLDIRIKTHGENHKRVTLLYHNKGILYSTIGDNLNALSNLNKALAIKQKIHPKQHPQIALTYIAIATVFSNLRDYQKALDYQEKGIEIIKEEYGPSHPYLSFAYNNLATTLAKKGDIEKAKEYALLSLKLKEKKLGKNHPSMSNNYTILATFHQDLGEFDKALEYHNYSIKATNDFLVKASLYENIGINRMKYGDFQESLVYYNKALKMRRAKLKWNHPKIAKSLGHIINVLIKQEKDEEAYDSLKVALGILDFSPVNITSQELVYDKNILKTLLISKVNYFSHKYQLSKDRVFLDSIKYSLNSMIELQDLYIKDSKDLPTQLYYLKEYQPIIGEAIENLDLKNNKKEDGEAFLLSEKIKNRFLASHLRYYLNAEVFNIPDSLIEKENQIKSELSNFETKKYLENFETKNPNDSLISIYADTIFNIKRERDHLHELFKNKYSDYYNLRFRQKLLTVKAVQDSLLESNQTLVEYFVGDSTIFTYVITQDTFSVFQTEKDFPLNQYVEDLRKGIYQPFQNDNTIPTDSLNNLYTQSAYQLFEKLVLPIKKLLPKQGELIIIPDGFLGYIPFDALLTEPIDSDTKPRDFPYLLKEYQTSIAYSATLLKEMRDKQHRKPPKKNFLGVAPLFEGEQDTLLYASRFIDYSNQRNRLTPLTENIPEVRSLQNLIGGDILIDSFATEAAFLERAGDYKVLHLSTHGKANDKVGDYSFLAFYELKDSLENEWLYNRELYDLELNADIVVLSACETGIGELQRGEGIISLARGFSYAGAKSIITSLWTVDDTEAPVLMKSFYEYLNKGYAKDAALRQAKLDYLQTSSKPQPYYWATFIPIGDMQPVSFQTGTPWWIWLGIIGVTLIALFWFYMRKVK